MIAVMTPPSVSAVLRDAYGAEFERATQTERLAFLEAIAFSLREDCKFSDSLALIFGVLPSTPADIYSSAELERNEALKLLAMLYVAIVEDYSVLATKERLAD